MSGNLRSVHRLSGVMVVNGFAHRCRKRCY